jgi:hypothetical protein
MANEKIAADSNSETSTAASCTGHLALVQRLEDAGYRVLETKPGERGIVWTLEPLHSQVEFQLIGHDELLRFLAATTSSP